MYRSILALSLCGFVAALPTTEAVSDLAPRDLPPFSPHTSHLKRVPNSEFYGLRKRAPTSSKLQSLNGGNTFLTTISFGSQQFEVVIDTGSSDTWLIGTNFTCLDKNGNPITEQDCDFGSTYDYSADTSLAQTPAEASQNFLLQYGDGEFLAGVLATDTVTFAGVTFQTEIGIGLDGYWNGDGTSSGLVGLAFPSLTSAYSGTDPTQDSTTTRVHYDPIMKQLFTDNGYTPAMFSIAMSRDKSLTGYGGSITMGGVPTLTDPRVNATANYVYTPFLIETGRTVLTYYNILVDALTWGTSGHTAVSHQMIVDSGTSYIFAPTPAATAFNALWPGGSQKDSSTGIWQVTCGAKPPPFAVTIAGHSFPINPRDLIHNYGDGTCVSTITDVGSKGTLILGDVFLKNVLAVFDWGKSRMGFTGREYYTS